MSCAEEARLHHECRQHHTQRWRLPPPCYAEQRRREGPALYAVSSSPPPPPPPKQARDRWQPRTAAAEIGRVQLDLPRLRPVQAGKERLLQKEARVGAAYARQDWPPWRADDMVVVVEEYSAFPSYATSRSSITPLPIRAQPRLQPPGMMPQPRTPFI